MTRRKKTSPHIAVVLITLLAMVLPIRAHADSITLGQSTSGNLSFTSNGNRDVTVGSTSITGYGYFDSDTGTYSLGNMSFVAGLEGPSGLFPASSNSESFSYSAGDGDFLTGSIVWSAIQDSTAQPKFYGLLTIATIGGDSAFTSSYGGVGSLADIDFITTRLTSGSTLDALAASPCGTKAWARISSGEIDATPEPNSLMLFGIGILGLGLWIRRQFGAEESAV